MPDAVTTMAVLVGEPFLLRPDEIGRLTDWQIQQLYCAKRKKDGTVIQQAVEPKRQTMEQAKLKYFAMGQGLGISREKLEAAWRAKHGG
jgi:hypothetical protein